MDDEGSFLVRLDPALADVRALHVLKAADLLVDDGQTEQLRMASREDRRTLRLRDHAHRPTMEAHLEEPLARAIEWGWPRLVEARAHWHLPAPFTVKFIRDFADQVFVIPDAERELSRPLSSLAGFAAEHGAGSFHWEPRSRSWVSDED